MQDLLPKVQGLQ